MPECLNCGEYVSKEFARVMGDNNGDVHRCMECGSQNVGSEAGGVPNDGY